MNSNNNSVGPEGIILFGVLALIFFIVKFVIIMVLSAAILAAIYTSVIMLFALNKPLEIDGETITPELARTFFGGGIAGALGCFAITALSSDLGLHHPKEIILLSPVVGYIVGAFGAAFEMLLEAEQEREEAERASEQQILLPPPPPVQPPAPRPFTFADWDDEEELR